MAKTRPRNRPRAAIQEPRFSKATIKPRFSEATIEVVSVSSSGLPTYYSKVTPGESDGFLHKAAAKLEDTGDLIRLGEEVFSCGWPDITVTYRYPGISTNACREVTLVNTDEPEAKPSTNTCPLAELRRKRKELVALLESQALKARSIARCASCWDQGESASPIHPQAMRCNSRGEQR